MNISADIKKRISYSIFIVLISAVIIGLLIACYHQLSVESEGRIFAGKIGSYGEGWERVMEDGTTVPFNVDQETVEAESLVLRHDLKSMEDSGSYLDSLGFYSMNNAVKVYIDGEEIYSTSNITDNESAVYLGNYYCIVPAIGEDEIRIEYYNPAGSINFYHFLRGSYEDLFKRTVRSCIAPLGISVIGVAMMFVVFMMLIFGGHYKEMLQSQAYLILFTVSASIWMITDSQLAPLLLDDAGSISYLSEEMFMLMVIPLSLFLYYSCKQLRKLDIFMAVLLTANLIAANILHFTGIISFAKTSLSTRLLFVIILIMIFIQVITEFRREKEMFSVMLLGGFSVLMISSLIQIFVSSTNIVFNNTHYFRIGYMVFLMSQFIYVIRVVFRQVEKGYRVEIYKKLAVTDSLTGIQNRRAMDRELDELEGGEVSNIRFACFSCDLDGLKQANDTLGHAAGDELIKGIAGCLTTAFKGIGEVYRTGGDEFYIICTDTEFEMQVLLNRLSYIINDYNREHELKLAYSIGSAVGRISSNDVKSIQALINEADEQMYEMKREHHAVRDQINDEAWDRPNL